MGLVRNSTHRPACALGARTALCFWGVPPMAGFAALGGLPPVGDAPVVPVVPAAAHVGMNPNYQPPSAAVSACVCVHNRQLVWQLQRYEGRLAPGALNTKWHYALIRARNSAKTSPHVIHLGNFHNLVWVNRSQQGQYVWAVVRDILQTFSRAGQPQCIRQFPHDPPGYCNWCAPGDDDDDDDNEDEDDDDDRKQHEDILVDDSLEDLWTLMELPEARTFDYELTGTEEDIKNDVAPLNEEMKDAPTQRFVTASNEHSLDMSIHQIDALKQMSAHQKRWVKNDAADALSRDPCQEPCAYLGNFMTYVFLSGPRLLAPNTAKVSVTALVTASSLTHLSCCSTSGNQTWRDSYESNLESCLPSNTRTFPPRKAYCRVTK